MHDEQYILSLDQGTTSSRALIYDSQGISYAKSQLEFQQLYVQEGWVEHDPVEIWSSQLAAAYQAVQRSQIPLKQIAAIGITNQRETTIVWNRKTGIPIYNAIVWQDRRTAHLCDQLVKDGLREHIHSTTGLHVDSYFSATKIRWILDNVEGAQHQAEHGDLCFGTVDSWLIWNLTEGAVHATDYTNAARTMLFNIKTLDWDPILLDRLHIPRAMLPEVLPSSGEFGNTAKKYFDGMPITGVAGDQHAALFGQACYRVGEAKSTYGTGSFVLMNTGETPMKSHEGLITTIAWCIGGDVVYALEGSIFVTGAGVQWLRDELHLIHDAHDTEYYASKVADTGGVYVVPAFAGLGAPHWDMYARGTIVGITRGTNRNHIIRAVLEGIAYQTKDVMECMEHTSGIEISSLRAAGGASANDFLMQFQADILGIEVIRPADIEATSRGAASLARIGRGIVEYSDIVNTSMPVDRQFRANMDSQHREKLYTGWKRAVERAKAWVQE